MNAPNDFHSPDPSLSRLLDQALAGPQPPPDLTERIIQATARRLSRRSMILLSFRRNLAVAALVSLAALTWLALDRFVIHSRISQPPLLSPASPELTCHRLWSELQDIEAALDRTFQELEQDLFG